MAPINLDSDEVGITEIFAGMAFPAPRWRVIAEAVYWGAGCECLSELAALPIRQYYSLTDLTQTMHESRERLATVVRPRRLAQHQGPPHQLKRRSA